jgi:site-specific DNA recombinase
MVEVDAVVRLMPNAVRWTVLSRGFCDPAILRCKRIYDLYTVEGLSIDAIAPLDRRVAAARVSDPSKPREQSLQGELTRADKSIDRLLSAYQEELVSLEQLRERMPPLRQRQQALRAELQAIADQINDRAMFLRLVETLTAFLARLRSAATTLDVLERQRIVRLVVKEVLIGDDTIVIREPV